MFSGNKESLEPAMHRSPGRGELFIRAGTFIEASVSF
jgi:hypothetical protein